MTKIDFAVSFSTTVKDEFELQFTIEENQSTKFDECFKIDRPKTKLKRRRHIAECPGRN